MSPATSSKSAITAPTSSAHVPPWSFSASNGSAIGNNSQRTSCTSRAYLREPTFIGLLSDFCRTFIGCKTIINYQLSTINYENHTQPISLPLPCRDARKGVRLLPPDTHPQGRVRPCLFTAVREERAAGRTSAVHYPLRGDGRYRHVCQRYPNQPGRTQGRAPGSGADGSRLCPRQVRRRLPANLPIRRHTHIQKIWKL